jgi:hypothetical protein
VPRTVWSGSRELARARMVEQVLVSGWPTHEAVVLVDALIARETGRRTWVIPGGYTGRRPRPLAARRRLAQEGGST